MALLIYLALNGLVFHRRDRLLALFWPESDEKGARGSLSQALFQLRTSLGKDVIVNRGDDEIGLAPGAIWCDVAAFKEAARNGDHQGAMALYSGELLPSFTIADAPEFEDWLADERRACAEQAAACCGELSVQAEQRANLDEAVRWLRRAVAIDPYKEPAHQRLIALLDQSGDRAAALRAYEELRALLRAEFDADPSAETLELIRAVRERASAGPHARVSQAASNVRVAAPPFTRAHMRRPRVIVTAVSVVLVIAALVWSALSERGAPAYKPPANHVAVLYFDDQSPNRNLGYLAESLTSTLIDQLGHVHKLKVISQNGVRPFRGQRTPLDSIARQLDAGSIVGGSVTQSNGRLRVTVEMIDGATGIVVQSRTLQRPNGELFALLDDLSSEVSSFLRMTVGQEVKVREWQAETHNVDAWRALQQAEYLRATVNESDRKGDVRSMAAQLAQADSLALQSLKLDDKFASAVVLRGRIAEARAWVSLMADTPPQPTRWLTTANQLADQAVRMDANSAAALELRGSVDQARWLLLPPPEAASDSLLRTAERDLRAAIKLDSERPRAESILSGVLYVQGRFAEARNAALRALEADAYLTDAEQIVNRLFQTSFELGDDAEAGRWCDEVRRRSGGHWPAAYCDLMLLAWSSESGHDPRKALHLLENFGPLDSDALRQAMRPRLEMLSAAVFARAGMRDSAQVMLARARARAPGDIELLHLEAAARTATNDDAQAIELLRKYLRLNPGARYRIENSRIFRRLADRLD
ncbi:MAG TPA: BTAD domain-containing putative transcriptional regulator [Longimicrobiales bacterium]